MNSEPAGPAERLRFGVFEADLRTGELYKRGMRIRLQNQPFQVLSALLERPGELVTHEELRQRIWRDVTVDFEHGVRTAVNKLREALRDTVENPRYIETVPKRGYRFVAPLLDIPGPGAEAVEASHVEPSPESFGPTRVTVQETRMAQAGSRRQWMLIVVCSLAVLATLSAWVWAKRPMPSPVTRFTRVTWSNRVVPGAISHEHFPGLATDGSRLYFTEMRDGRARLTYATLTDGVPHELITPSEIIRPTVAGISRDGTQLLIRSATLTDMEQPLWIVPSAGGSATRVLGGVAHDAVWTPNGKSIVYATGRQLVITDNSGGTPKSLATVPGRAYWLRYAPDGASLRFTVIDPVTRATSLWQISADGQGVRPLLAGWSQAHSECCGDWTPDGRFFVYLSKRAGGIGSVWAIPEGHRVLPLPARPFQITAGPLSCLALAPSRRSDRVFVIASQSRTEGFRVDLSSKRLFRYLPEIPAAGRSEISRDGRRVAWISRIDRTLWQSRLNGSEHLQLTPSSIQVGHMHWSPDDRWIALVGKEQGSPYRIYIVAANGGALEIPLKEACSQTDPDWSPDGHSIAFGRMPNYAAEDPKPKAIHLFNLQTRALSTLPGSEGLFSPHWSPDGRHIAAMTLDQKKLLLFDTTTQQWKELLGSPTDIKVSSTHETHRVFISNPMWSKDGMYIYYQANQEEFSPLYRIRASDQHIERLLDSRDLQLSDATEFWGFGPRGEPILFIHQSNTDIYAVDYQAPFFTAWAGTP